MKIKTRIITGLFILLLIGIPTTVYLALTQQNSQSSAHTAHPTATTTCTNGVIMITFTDYVNNLSGGSVTVTVSDTLHIFDGIEKKGLTEGQSFTVTKSTGKNVLQAGDELIHTVATFSNWPVQTDDIPVAPAGPCTTPTPVPSLGATPTIGLTATPAPTETPACLVPSPVSNVKIICPNCNNQ